MKVMNAIVVVVATTLIDACKTSGSKGSETLSEEPPFIDGKGLSETFTN